MLDSIVSESAVSSEDSLEQIETLSSLSDEAEDVEASETDEVTEEETEEISDEVEEVESQTQVASVDNLSIDNTNNLNLGSGDGFNLTSPLTGTSSLLVNSGSAGSGLLGGVPSLGSVSILSAAASMGVEALGSVEVSSVLGEESTTLLDTVVLEESPIEEGEVIFNEPVQEEVQELDFDGDGISDNADTDDDNDGALDTVDAFPNDASESSDFDGDGVGDNADTDDDEDGVLDDNDAFPFDDTETADFDSDGTGDNADTDDDNDGVLDVDDAFPFDADNGSTTDSVPTTGDDDITGGEDQTEFVYDFDSNVGGSDTLSDTGSTDDDRILFKNIPDNHTLFVSRDPDSDDMRIETFSTQDPVPSDPSHSINTITTAVSNEGIGIENIAFTTSDNSYDADETIRIEDFYTLGSSDTNNMAQVITGTSGDDSFE